MSVEEDFGAPAQGYQPGLYHLDHERLVEQLVPRLPNLPYENWIHGAHLRVALWHPVLAEVTEPAFIDSRIYALTFHARHWVIKGRDVYATAPSDDFTENFMTRLAESPLWYRKRIPG